MATTTNYSWTTPDDTALVKDGAAAIRSLGTAIDTTVFTNAGNAIAKTIVDAKGDIIAATAADTVARLAVGANDTVLTADSSTATGLKWGTISAGGMTLISTTTISNNASIDLTSIPSTYNHLQLVLISVVPATDGDSIRLRVNADTNNRYRSVQYLDINQAAATMGAGAWVVTDALDNSASTMIAVVNIPEYTNTTTWKTAYGNSIQPDQTTATSVRTNGYIHSYNQTAAITSLTIFGLSGNLNSGTIKLYGVK